MNTSDLLRDLRDEGVRLWMEGDRLRVSAPRGVVTDEVRAELASRKAEILDRLRSEARPEEAPQPRPLPREGPMPLSFGQERLWFLHQMDPDSPVYNVQLDVHFGGRADLGALERSLEEVFRRHEILRTTFTSDHRGPVQVIHAPGPVPLAVVDLRDLPEPEREAKARAWRRHEGETSFDLVHGPMTRVILLRHRDEEQELILTQHHIVTDGWSIALLLEEILTLYGAFSRGESSPLPELPFQYADFAAWQRECLRGRALEGQLAYWRGKLRDLPVLQLPTDHPRPPVQTFDGALQFFDLPEGLSARLRALARARRTTLFTTLLTAFATLLARYSGQEEVVVGTSNGSRGRRDLEKLLGFFVNTQVLRLDLSGDPTFAEAMEEVGRTALDAFSHQDVPFEKLIEEVKPERDLSRSPLFQVMLIVQNTPLEGLSRSLRTSDGRNPLGIHDGGDVAGLLGARTVSAPGGSRPLVEGRTSKFDMTLYVQDTAEGIRGDLEYNTDLFEHETVTRLLNHLERLLGAVVENPAARLSELPLVTPEEEVLLLHEWNRTEAGFPDRPVHHLVEDRAAEHPEGVAVTFEGRSVTYGELNRRANRLAHRLAEEGLGPGAFAGVFVDRSPEMVVALLGILKTGAAYLPLDPTYPAERIAFMLRDSGASVIVTEEKLAATLPETDAGVVVLDAPGALRGGGEDDPPPRATSDDPAYAIYTSGSTGRPKGVLIPHRALVNFLLSMREEPGLTSGDRLVAVTTLSFDIAGLELWLPLIVGARVVLLSSAAAWDAARLMEALERSGATVMQATPATWRLLLDSGWEGTPGLRILCGGEALPRELADRLLECGDEVWNLYGPTETTIWSTLHRVARDRGPVPIGRPIANTTVYIVDPRLRPVPVGVPGEIHIGGAGLARGYLNRPELTAERFTPDPFAGDGRGRLYRTGDLARYRADGTIEYLARVDQQVKLRGFRIELGEVEAALADHPGVAAAVASVYEVSPGDQRLVAYVIPEAEPPEPGDLRASLRERLPDYMLPSLVEFVRSFPLTPNGKIDRKSLPEPSSGRGDKSHGYVQPGTQMETTIAAVWSDVLGTDRVGIADNFFDLGGHSLLMARVHRALVDKLQKEISIIDLFRYPTVETLAHHLEGGGAGSGPPRDSVPRRVRAERKKTARRRRSVNDAREGA